MPSSVLLEKSLLYLDSKCDGAVDEDGVGFNGTDSRFGKSLAEQIGEGDTLSNRQLIAAYSMIGKYRRQLESAGIVASELTAERQIALATIELEKPDTKTTGTINLSRDVMSGNDYIIVRFEYDNLLVQKMQPLKKSIGAYFRKIDGDKFWVIKIEYYATIVERFPDFDISLELSDYAKARGLDTKPIPKELKLVPTEEIEDTNAVILEPKPAPVVKVDTHKAPETAKLDMQQITIGEEEEEEAKKPEVIAKPFLTIGEPAKLALELRPFQNHGVSFVEQVDGRAIIADEMGLGKTPQGIAFVVKHEFRALVVCPASLKRNWELEINKFSPDSTTNILDSSDTDYYKDFTIINYDILDNHVENIQGLYELGVGFDVLILDEGHYIKNTKTKRTQAVLELDCVPRKIILTGTPLLNRPAELFPLLRFINPWKWDNFAEFKRKFCSGGMTSSGWDGNGASNLQELHELLQDTMIRRKKSEVLPELPDKQITDIMVELSHDTRITYNRIFDNYIEFLREQERYAEAKRAGNAEHLVKIQALKQLCSADKLKSAKEFIDTALEQNGDSGKILVFSQYKDVVKDIYEEYGSKVVKITGESSSSQRQNAVEEFQNNDEVKILVGTIKAAGVGFTLTQADKVLFIDLAWTPSDHDQAEDRAHRIGQKEALNVYYLIADETIDQKIKGILGSKRKVINQVIDGSTDETITDTSTLNELTSQLKREYAI